MNVELDRTNGYDRAGRLAGISRISVRPGSPVLIEALVPADWPAVRAIYEEGIATRHATFETVVPEWEQWNACRLPDCRLVARRGRQIIGWATLSPISSRSVYRGVAEDSIYVAAGARRQGAGRALLESLIDASEAAGIWTMQAGIFPENAASVNLHLACGFRLVGRRERLGMHRGIWRDALLLERRSSRVGVGSM